jgi:hypothetical protein
LLRASLNHAEAQANSVGAHIVAIGILPTLTSENFQNDWMSANPRYAMLNEAVFAARGEDLFIDIANPTAATLSVSLVLRFSAGLTAPFLSYPFQSNWTCGGNGCASIVTVFPGQNRYSALFNVAVNAPATINVDRIGAGAGNAIQIGTLNVGNTTFTVTVMTG